MIDQVFRTLEQELPHDEAFDRRLRTQYRDAATRLSPRARAQLQQRVRAALSPGARPGNSRRVAWGLAVACSLALVVGLGQRWQASNGAPHATNVPIAGVAGDNGELVATLDETPDLYLWVASDDAAAMTSE
jgi:hypothetical protein